MNKRIIKKYNNRRLYDMENSCYITLNEIKEYVIAHINFEVRDAKTDKDLTNAVLLQIILEEENFNKPLFTEEILKNLIRFYGHPAQQAVSDFLQQVTQSLSEKVSPESMQTLLKLGQQNINLWNQAISGFFTEFNKKNPKNEP